MKSAFAVVVLLVVLVVVMMWAKRWLNPKGGEWTGW
jgi:hypothetical protein